MDATSSLMVFEFFFFTVNISCDGLSEKHLHQGSVENSGPESSEAGIMESLTELTSKVHQKELTWCTSLTCIGKMEPERFKPGASAVVSSPKKINMATYSSMLERSL